MTILSLSNLSKEYHLTSHKSSSIKELLLTNLFKSKTKTSLWALKDINFSLEKGHTLGIIGSNGSGKSTLLKIISGITFPTNGEIIKKGKVAALLELGAGFHPEFSGLENIYLNGAIIGLSKNEIDNKLEAIINFSELAPFINTPVKHYSSGMYVRLGFSIAVNLDPDILLIDEDLSVGDEAFQVKSFHKIREFKEKGKTIIIVSHDIESVESLCDQILWLDKGCLKMFGSSEEVISKYRDDFLKQTVPPEPENINLATTPIIPRGRFGSGEIIFTSVKIFNEKNKETRTVLNGEDIKIELKYKAKQKIENPDFRIAITHFNTTGITMISTAIKGLEFDELDGEGILNARIENFPLKKGRYLLTLCIGPKGDYENAYDLHLRLYPFTVIEDNSDGINYMFDVPYQTEIR